MEFWVYRLNFWVRVYGLELRVLGFGFIRNCAARPQLQQQQRRGEVPKGEAGARGVKTSRDSTGGRRGKVPRRRVRGKGEWRGAAAAAVPQTRASTLGSTWGTR